MSKVKSKRKKLTDKQKKLIIADYIECGNYCEVARKHGITDTTYIFSGFIPSFFAKYVFISAPNI